MRSSWHGRLIATRSRRLGTAAGREFKPPTCGPWGSTTQDGVQAFNRGQHPDGRVRPRRQFLRSWARRVSPRHGVPWRRTVTIWLTDDGDHTVRQCTLDGKCCSPSVSPASRRPHSGEPFTLHAHGAVAAGRLYVSDGYAMRASTSTRRTARSCAQWGAGTDPGQFNIAHNICCDATAGLRR